MTLKITSPLGMQVVDIISFLFPLPSRVNLLTCQDADTAK